MKLIHVGGARGVGKTTVLSRLSSADIKVVSLSSLLQYLAKRDFKKEWRDTYNDERIMLRKNAVLEISKINDKLVILDSHYVDVAKGYPVTIFPQELIEMVFCHIIIEAPPASILSRRIADKKVSRVLALKTIEMEVQSERVVAIEIAKTNSAIFHLIENFNVDRASKEIDWIIESINTAHE